MLTRLRCAQVDLVLIERLLRYICGVEPYGKGSNGAEVGSVKGAVLVFLPVRHLAAEPCGACVTHSVCALPSFSHLSPHTGMVCGQAHVPTSSGFETRVSSGGGSHVNHTKHAGQAVVWIVVLQDSSMR